MCRGNFKRASELLSLFLCLSDSSIMAVLILLCRLLNTCSFIGSIIPVANVAVEELARAMLSAEWSGQLPQCVQARRDFRGQEG